MGLFDYLKCEYPVSSPDTDGELVAWHSRQNEFETRHFDCLLAEHRIPRRGKMPPSLKPEED